MNRRRLAVGISGHLGLCHDDRAVVTLQGKHILVGVGGGIAAYKAVELVRQLGRRGAQVRVAVTPAGRRFVGAMTFAGLTGEAPASDLWDERYPGEVHVALSEWADAIVVAPATHNLMARICAGMADDPVLATLACAACPVFLAPAMHSRMWLSAANQRNVAILERDGLHLIGPVEGRLASGQYGIGRMVEPAVLADTVTQTLGQIQDLSGRTVLVSAGPTQEDLDPVRYLSNRSSGRMGFAIAEAALARGARVVLVCGPTALTPPHKAEVISVRSALQMHEAVTRSAAQADVVVMAAAVADYRPRAVAAQKIKKGDDDKLVLEFVKNPDILEELGRQRSGRRPVLVGFAMETEDVAGHARCKLEAKGADLIVGNEAAVGFGGEENEAVFITAERDENLPRMTKLALGHRILDRILDLI